MLRKLIDKIKGSSTPKRYDTRQEMVYSYELNLLRAYMTHKGERPEIERKLKAFSAWRLQNGK